MIRDVQSILERSSETLVEDALGAASLFLLLFAGLALPSLF